MVELTSDNTGEDASLDIDDGTGTPIADALGFSTSQTNGTQTAADDLTLLNDLVTNKGNYADGDLITLTGTDASGLAVQADFVYGLANDGVDVDHLVDFISTNFTTAECTLDSTTGNLVLTADDAGVSNLSLFLHDHLSATGTTSWPNFSVSTEGTDPDKITTSASVFDSMGVSHTLIIDFERYYDPTYGTIQNTWDVNVSVQNNEGSVTANLIKRITFDNNGSFGSIVGEGAAGNTITVAFSNTGEEQDIIMDFGTQSGYDGLTQVGEGGSVQISSQNGYAAGTLSTLSVEPNGEILGHYTNGRFETISTIGLASFSNASGMEKQGDSLFNVTPNSGSPVMGVPGTGTHGAILTGALEQSNIDIGEEFVALIEAQRGFQANARIISTSDEVLTEMVNLVR